jgi:hypothetical protein
MPDTNNDKIEPNDAAKMIFPIDVDGIREELKKILAKPNAAAFIKRLIAGVVKNAAPGNTLVEDGDVLKIYDLIQKQKGMVRSGDTARGAIPGANFALGSIATGDAGIQIGNFRPGVAVTLQELKDAYLKSDAPFALHETLHHAGRLVYSDQEFAIVVSTMPGVSTPLPTSGNRFEFSHYWDTELRKACR